MLATTQAREAGQGTAGDLLPQSDRALALCIDEAKCQWEELEDYFEGIVESEGRRHRLDSSQLSTAQQRISALKNKMQTLKNTLDAQKDSLSFNTLDDRKLASTLAKCLEKNICAAYKRIDKLYEKFMPRERPGESPLPPNPPKVGALEKSADIGEDLMGEALRNLVLKAKTQKAARVKAARTKPGRKKAHSKRYVEDLEDGARRGVRLRDSKKARARKKTARKRTSSSSLPSAKVEKNSYLALEKIGKSDVADSYYFEILPLELSGDFVVNVDIGLFSDKSQVHDAAGDGEQGCVELSTVGSAPSAAFVSLCGRQNAALGRYEAYMLTPSGARAVTGLPGVEVAEFQVTVRNGTIVFQIRDADVRGAWTLVDQVDAPSDPLTIGLGASLLGTNDEIGLDNLSIEALDPAN